MRICIFCGASSSLDPEVKVQIKFVMDQFAQNNVELVYGGAGIGIMGDLATELMNRGGSVIGVIPQHLTKKEIMHAGLTSLHVVKDMHERKKMMYELSDAFLVFPGGMGTLDELFEILTWRQLGLHQKPIAVLNINNYFDHLFSFLDHAVRSGLINPNDRKILFSSSNWNEIWAHFKREN